MLTLHLLLTTVSTIGMVTLHNCCMLLLTENIKSFLTEFYRDGEDGGKDFKYGQQLVSSTFYIPCHPCNSVNSIHFPGSRQFSGPKCHLNS